MARLSVDQALGRNMLAFLDMIAWSEIGPDILAAPEADEGYRVCVGSRPRQLILMSDYTEHPRIRDTKLNSDAAGRYQLLGRYFEPYKHLLGLPDFGPESQDRIAIQMIRECHAVNLVQGGQFGQAVIACKSRWASLPGAGYAQHESTMESLEAVYLSAGGTLS